MKYRRDKQLLERRAYNEQVLNWFIKKYRDSFFQDENNKRKELKNDTK